MPRSARALPAFFRRQATAQPRTIFRPAVTPAALIAPLLAAVIATPALAAVDLIAIGSIPGTYQDLAHETAAPLESGIAGNRLGGIGSGLAYAGGTTFLALPDRGPNAVDYGAGAIDNTTSYIPRFHTFDLSLAANPNYPDEAGSLPYVLTPTLRQTTLLFSRTRLAYAAGGEPALNERGTYYFSGRSDNFDAAKPSTNPNNARLDPEGIRVSRDGRSVYISDEYGPYLYEFSRATGERLRSIKLPANFAAAKLSASGAVEISGNTSGRVANKGMEGLAITPDGRTLVGFEQSPLIQDGGDGGRANRIVTVDLMTGATRQYVYDNRLADKNKNYNSSEILAVNNHQFLVLERDGKGRGDGSAAVIKRLYLIDLAKATDVSNLSGEANLLPYAVPKTLFLDIKAALTDHGLAATDVPAKLEGAAFGPDITIDGQVRHTLYIANDNDYDAASSNPNQFFVFTFGDDDLPGYVPQQFTHGNPQWPQWPHGDHWDHRDGR